MDWITELPGLVKQKQKEATIKKNQKTKKNKMPSKQWIVWVYIMQYLGHVYTKKLLEIHI